LTTVVSKVSGYGSGPSLLFKVITRVPKVSL